ncbi:3-isopropylmalate dehydratase small subunit [Pigmentiphaga soli]|uniref:3-isopropylmalate dehydratase small subunit n=1 Tax=Pigmentiphaga soli TaxID=1007095 RepID=A0ABP8HLB9_9BURK
MISGRVWKFGDDINTDLILPGPVVHQPIAVQLRNVFAANRPGWVDAARPGDVLVGGRNFGMGSARPAPRVLRELKLGLLLAEQINSLFLRSCVNFGFLALDCPGVTAAFEEGDTAELDLDAWTVRNARTGAVLHPARVPAKFLAMMREGGIYPMLEAEGLIAPPASRAYVSASS